MPGGEELSSWLACLMIFGCFGDDDMALLKFAINSSGDDGETPCLEVFPCWLDLFRLLAILAMGAAFLIGLLSTGFCALALSCVICCLFCLFCKCGGSFGAGRFGCMLPVFAGANLETFWCGWTVPVLFCGTMGGGGAPRTGLDCSPILK